MSRIMLEFEQIKGPHSRESVSEWERTVMIARDGDWVHDDATAVAVDIREEYFCVAYNFLAHRKCTLLIQLVAHKLLRILCGFFLCIKVCRL